MIVAPCEFCYRAQSCKVECPAFVMFTDEEKTREQINPPPCGFCARRNSCTVECASFRTWERSGV